MEQIGTEESDTGTEEENYSEEEESEGQEILGTKSST